MCIPLTSSLGLCKGFAALSPSFIVLEKSKEARRVRLSGAIEFTGQHISHISESGIEMNK